MTNNTKSSSSHCGRSNSIQLGATHTQQSQSQARHPEWNRLRCNSILLEVEPKSPRDSRQVKMFHPLKQLVKITGIKLVLINLLFLSPCCLFEKQCKNRDNKKKLLSGLDTDFGFSRHYLKRVAVLSA